MARDLIIVEKDVVDERSSTYQAHRREVRVGPIRRWATDPAWGPIRAAPTRARSQPALPGSCGENAWGDRPTRLLLMPRARQRRCIYTTRHADTDGVRRRMSMGKETEELYHIRRARAAGGELASGRAASASSARADRPPRKGSAPTASLSSAKARRVAPAPARSMLIPWSHVVLVRNFRLQLLAQGQPVRPDYKYADCARGRGRTHPGGFVRKAS
jgi:hypothetical protein